MRRLWIHIGAHKTGTTFLQGRFHRHDGDLAKQGLLYPETGRHKLGGHHNLALMIAPPDGLAATRQALAVELDGFAGDVLLSSENFEFLTANQMKTLGELFDPVEIRVIYLYRHWATLLYSAWQEAIKQGAIGPFDSFALSELAFWPESKLLNFDLPIDMAEAAFGPGTVRIANYDTLRKQGTLLPAFCQLLGIALDDSSGDDLGNPSMSPVTAEICRALAVLARQNGAKPDHELRLHFRKKVRGLKHPLAARLAEMMKPHLRDMPDLRRSPLVTTYLDDFMTRHAARFFSPPDPDALAGVRIPQTVSSAYLFDPAARQTLEMLYVRLMASFVPA